MVEDVKVNCHNWGGPGGFFAANKAAKLGIYMVLYENGKTVSGINCAEGFVDKLGWMGKPEVGVLFKVERWILFAGKVHHLNLREDQGLMQ